MRAKGLDVTIMDINSSSWVAAVMEANNTKPEEHPLEFEFTRNLQIFQFMCYHTTKSDSTGTDNQNREDTLHTTTTTVTEVSEGHC